MELILLFKSLGKSYLHCIHMVLCVHPKLLQLMISLSYGFLFLYNSVLSATYSRDQLDPLLLTLWSFFALHRYGMVHAVGHV